MRSFLSEQTADDDPHQNAPEGTMCNYWVLDKFLSFGNLPTPRPGNVMGENVAFSSPVGCLLMPPKIFM